MKTPESIERIDEQLMRLRRRRDVLRARRRLAVILLREKAGRRPPRSDAADAAKGRGGAA